MTSLTKVRPAANTPMTLLAMLLMVLVASTARGQVKDVVTARLSFQVGVNKVKVPYARNHPLQNAHPNATRAIIVIHGNSRDADSTYRAVHQVTAGVGRLDDTIILAPQFLTPEDIDEHDLAADLLRWSSGGWKRGDRSKPIFPYNARLSSFEIVDQLLRRLANRTRFPNLRTLVVAGHSAGGQFVNRYAAGSPVEFPDISVRYIVANPSSYLYMDGERRVPGSNVEFAVPHPDIARCCRGYNDYKYGLESLNHYMGKAGADTIRNRYLNRRVFYLLGELDTETDPLRTCLDTNCAAMYQGLHRLQRGRAYHTHLMHHYGSGIARIHTLHIVGGVGHSASGIYNSTDGRAALFD